jgi:hypothetical protein
MLRVETCLLTQERDRIEKAFRSRIGGKFDPRVGSLRTTARWMRGERASGQAHGLWTSGKLSKRR